MQVVLKKSAYRFARISLLLLLFFLVSYPFYKIFSQTLLILGQVKILLLIKEKLKVLLSFSLSSSFLSSFFSLCLALLNATLLKRTYVLCRKVILVFLFLPFGIPPIVSTLSLVVFFGKKGQLLWLLSFFDLTDIWVSKNLYSYAMINFLNLLYNVPLLTLLFWSLSFYFPFPLLTKARLLGASRLRQFSSVSFPLYKPHLLAAFCLVFVYCYQSYFPVQFLGNKLGYLTSEILIYEQLTWNFSLSHASFIALLQIFLVVGILSFFLLQEPCYTPYHLNESDERPSNLLATLASLLLSSFSVLIWLPLLIKTFSLGTDRFLNSFLFSIEPIKNSLIIAFSTSILVMCLSTYLLFNYSHLLSKKMGLWCLFLPFTLSPMLTSYFYQNLLGRLFSDYQPFLVLILTQVVTQLPLSIYLLYRDMAHFKELPLRAKNLGAKAFSRWISLDWPLFKRSYFYLFFLNLITSLGQLSASMLFLNGNFQTLPLRINQLLNFYRIEEAVNLATLSVILFLVLLGVYAWINKKLESSI